MTTAQPTLADQEWLDRVIAAGVPVVDSAGVLHDGTSQSEREAAQARVEREASGGLPSIIPVPVNLSAHTLVVTTMDGEEYKLSPKLRWGTLTESLWYAQQIEKRNEEVEEATTIEQVIELKAEIHTLEHGRVKLTIPNLPDGLLNRLDQVQVKHIDTVIQRLTIDAQELVYDMEKKTYGPHWERIEQQRMAAYKRRLAEQAGSK